MEIYSVRNSLTTNVLLVQDVCSPTQFQMFKTTRFFRKATRTNLNSSDHRRQEEDNTPKRGDLEENDVDRRKPEGPKESGDTKLNKNKTNSDTINNNSDTINNNVMTKQKNSLVFNYSSIILSEPMERLLNRGFNFSILPNKMDLTQVLTDYKKFERRIIWHEYHFGKDDQSEDEKPAFRTQKTNLPKNNVIPEGLKVFLNSVKSELLDPRNRNKEECNIPVDEIIALKELIQLKKDQKIVIKACDKGAGIMILNFSEYMKACYDHLLSKTADGQKYYEKVDDFSVERAKVNITNILKEGLENNFINKQEYDSMIPEDKNPGKFYSNLKVHKPHTYMKAPPPVRPINSGSGSLTEGIATFVEHHIKQSATTHSTYLQDTPDFLRIISHINKGPKLKIMLC